MCVQPVYSDHCYTYPVSGFWTQRHHPGWCRHLSDLQCLYIKKKTFMPPHQPLTQRKKVLLVVINLPDWRTNTEAFFFLFSFFLLTTTRKSPISANPGHIISPMRCACAHISSPNRNESHFSLNDGFREQHHGCVFVALSGNLSHTLGFVCTVACQPPLRHTRSIQLMSCKCESGCLIWVLVAQSHNFSA